MSSTERHAAKKPAKKGKNGKITPLGRVVSFIGSFIMWLVIIICLAMFIPRIAGIDSYVVISGSMEPAIPVGSLVYSKEVDPATLIPGEVIVFYSSSGTGGSSQTGNSRNTIPVTHRVIENRQQEGEIVTKGDANAHEDLFPVTYNNVLGRVVFHIRSLGYVASLLSGTAGKIGAILVIAAGYLLTEAANNMRQAE